MKKWAVKIIFEMLINVPGVKITSVLMQLMKTDLFHCEVVAGEQHRLSFTSSFILKSGNMAR